MKRAVPTVILVLAVAGVADARTYYVAPDGSASNPGTAGAPWALRYALAGAGGAVRPDDTVIIREGTYSGHYRVTASGTEGHPVVFRGEPGKRVTIDGYFVTKLTADVPGGPASEVVTVRLDSYADYSDGAQLVAASETGHGEYLLNVRRRGDSLTATRSCPFDTPCAPLAKGAQVWTTGLEVLLLDASAHDVWVWGLEITDSGTDYRTSQISDDSHFYNEGQRRRNGISSRASRSKIIDCVVHDNTNNVFTYARASDVEYSGIVTYNSGWLAPDRGHGHGWYIQHEEDAGTLTIRNSIALNAFGLLGQVYTGRPGPIPQGAIIFDHDVFVATDTGAFPVMVNNQLLIGGGGNLRGVTLSNSHVYGRAMSVGYRGQTSRVRVLGNTFRPIVKGSDPGVFFRRAKDVIVRGNRFFPVPADDAYLLSVRFDGEDNTPADYVFDHNEYHASNTKAPFVDFVTSLYDVKCGGFWWSSQRDGYGYCGPHSWTEELGYDVDGSTFTTEPPSGVSISSWVDPYDPSRHTVVVYNFDRAAAVPLDVAALGWAADQIYELRNAADYYDDVIRGTYDGRGTILLPMTGHSIAKPHGFATALGVDTFPAFGVFVLDAKTAGAAAR